MRERHLTGSRTSLSRMEISGSRIFCGIGNSHFFGIRDSRKIKPHRDLTGIAEPMSGVLIEYPNPTSWPTEYITRIAVHRGHLYASSLDQCCIYNLSLGGRHRGFVNNTSAMIAFDGDLYGGRTCGNMWRLRDGEIRTILGHDECITSFCVSGRFMFSASHDKSIKIWTGGPRCSKTINCSSIPCCLCAFDGKVLSGHLDGTIRRWTVDGHLEYTVQDNNLPVRYIVASHRYIFSVSRNLILRWNVETGECGAKFEPPPSRAFMGVCVFDEHPAVVDAQGVLYQINERSDMMLTRGDITWSPYTLIEFNGHLYGVGRICNLKRWKISGVRSLLKQCLSTIRDERHLFSQLQLARLPYDLAIRMSDLVNLRDVAAGNDELYCDKKRKKK